MVLTINHQLSIVNYKLFTKMAIKTLYIIRHGETNYNSKGIIQGRGINSKLNEKGLQQASGFYTRYKNENFDKIYVSTLHRTAQTVEQFINDGIAFEKLSGLDEMDWGDYEGRVMDKHLITKIKKILGQWKAGDYTPSAPNGENVTQVAKRLKDALHYIISRPENKILVCMHGRALLILLCIIFHVAFSEMDSFEHRNTGLYILKYNTQTKAFELIKRNDTSHLHTDT